MRICEKKSKAYALFCQKLGDRIIRAFYKQLSHPDVKIDMSPEFDNLLILTYGRTVYTFLQTEEGKKLWNEYSGK